MILMVSILIFVETLCKLFTEDKLYMTNSKMCFTFHIFSNSKIRLCLVSAIFLVTLTAVFVIYIKNGEFYMLLKEIAIHLGTRANKSLCHCLSRMLMRSPLFHSA